MNKFKYCPVVEVGDVFTRVDKNGKVWKAEVINRTEYFVDVKKTQPYQIKVADEGERGQLGFWHYEDAEPTIERCMLHRHYEEVEAGEEETRGLFGTYMKKIYEKVPTARYYIDCKEDYSKHWKYDRPYELIKYGDGVAENTEPAEVGFKKFWNYCETGKFELSEESKDE